MIWWQGRPVQRIDSSSRRHSHVGVSPVSCATASSSRTVGVKVASHQHRQSPAKQAVRPTPISGWECERLAVEVASNWVKPGTGTALWTTPRQTRMAVAPIDVGLSVYCQTKLASRKDSPGLRCISVNRQTSTTCSPRKCSSSSF